MKNRKNYVHSTQAWYASSLGERAWIDEVFFYNDEPWGEMAMRWYDIKDGEQSPKLEVYVESAAALASLTDVLAALAHISASREDKTFTPQDFCDLLDECGFIDATPRKPK